MQIFVGCITVSQRSNNTVNNEYVKPPASLEEAYGFPLLPS